MAQAALSTPALTKTFFFSRTKVRDPPMPLCSMAFSNQTFFGQHLKHNHLSEILPVISVRKHLQSEKPGPGDQNQQLQHSGTHG
ncbi:Histone-lysine N-methyltransferase PRDM9 [Myotis davidii]|uniref:Histone-lysine N-methyltransferase PRDM9 n=1 Tax=Myotis davidii TaxID=225400 RepID=L5M7R5_MYODS|nr:Histone-lysine N-methyltransferase PRDM9 [Myotis davidii]